MLRRTPLKKSSKPLRRSRIKPMSKKRQRESKAYSLLRAAFLENKPKCEACFHVTGYGMFTAKGRDMLANRSCDVHHIRGRTGGNYLNTDTWLAVCRKCHNWIHNHPQDARMIGLLS